MTITLHLGVIDQPYGVKAPRRVRSVMRKGQKPVRSTAPAAGAETTGDVAQYLEDRYHVMEVFSEIEGQAIADSLAGSMSDAIDRLLQTGQPPATIFPTEGQPKIQAAFNRFIDSRAMDGLQPGVPTAAAGGETGKVSRNSRKKAGVQAGSRPSFKRTGLYEQSFRAWVEET
jgi:hypothetical protein